MIHCTPNHLTLQLQGCDTQRLKVATYASTKRPPTLFRRRHRSGEFFLEKTLRWLREQQPTEALRKEGLGKLEYDPHCVYCILEARIPSRREWDEIMFSSAR